MLTQEENALLTRVGPGTPAGELLRRYWHPIAVAAELTDESPTKFVRALGEDLVLFRDKKSRVGLVPDRCPHRGASLLYGRVEERGIACAYHGWLYDTEGNCLECPAEPAESKFHLIVKHTAYPVQRFVGLYWAYMGPKPVPVIPKYDLFARKDGKRRITVHPTLDCNWLAAAENALDPSHLQILHQDLPMNKKTAQKYDTRIHRRHRFFRFLSDSVRHHEEKSLQERGDRRAPLHLPGPSEDPRIPVAPDAHGRLSHISARGPFPLAPG